MNASLTRLLGDLEAQLLHTLDQANQAIAEALQAGDVNIKESRVKPMLDQALRSSRTDPLTYLENISLIYLLTLV